MNDYLTAIATVENIRRPQPRSSWTHRPQPRRSKRLVGARIAAILRGAPAPRAAAAAC